MGLAHDERAVPARRVRHRPHVIGRDPSRKTGAAVFHLDDQFPAIASADDVDRRPVCMPVELRYTGIKNFPDLQSVVLLEIEFELRAVVFEDRRSAEQDCIFLVAFRIAMAN